MAKAFVSWSGGKDCCQSAFEAQKAGFEISCLVNMINPEVERSCSHGIAAKWIKLQAEAMGLPIIQQTTNGQNYAEQFTAALQKLRAEGITHGVFGDINFDLHRNWDEKVCRAADIEPVLPLWNLDHKSVAQEFIQQGFKTVVVTTRSDLLGEEWVGRLFDDQFLNDLARYPDISPCGEAGEFHTLVIDGPLFKKKLAVKEAGKVKRLDHWFLDIRKCELQKK